MTVDALDDLLHVARHTGVALRWDGQDVTYAQLAQRVAGLADRLTALGAAGTHVVVHGPLCPAYVVGLLAALRAHAVPVPVDAGMTPQQYAWLGAAARPSVVVASDVTAATQHTGVGPRTAQVVLDAGRGTVLLVTAPRAAAPRYTDPDAGYLVATSGSTGAPKAVVGSRTGLHAFLAWFVAELGVHAGDVTAAVTRVGFDPSLRELLAVLCVGGRVDLPPVDAQLDPRVLADHVASGATLAYLVPSVARRIGAVLDETSRTADGLRAALFAGEVLPRRLVDQWAKLAPRAELVNLYGMTEGTLAQLCRRDVAAAVAAPGGGLPVGRPRPGASVVVLDPDDTGLGDVVVRCDTPALGLLRTDADDLRVDPLPRDLRTGDVGVLVDGELVVVGRRGNDLKVDGRRVAYGAFVEAVEDLPGVRQCVVVEGPHAFVAADPDDALADRVRAVARRLRVPEPGVHLRAELPLQRNGKVDRVALTVEAAAAGTPHRPVRDTRGTVDELHALLGLPAGTPADQPFVAAGVTSVDLIGLTAHLRRRGVELSVRECYALGHAAAVAAVLDVAVATAVDTAATAAPPVPGPGTAPAVTPAAAVPLSGAQATYVATCMADGNADWCNISRVVPAPVGTVAADVRAALTVLVARHDALRLAVGPAGLEHVADAQVTDVQIADTADAPVDDVPVVGARAAHGPDLDHAAAVQRARVSAVTRLLDPAAPPPVRAVLVAGRTATSVVLVAHHLLVDGIGLDVLADELRALLAGAPLPAAPPPDAARGFAARTARRPGAPAAPHPALHGTTALRLPEATGPQAALGRIVSRPLGPLVTAAVARVAQAAGASAFDVLLAAYAQAVAHVTGVPRPPVVVPARVRDDVPARAVGMFTGQLVVRAPGALDLPDLVRALAEQVAAGAAPDAPAFEDLPAALHLPDDGRFPVSTVLFNQHPHARGLLPRDLGAWQPRDLGRTLRYQLQGEVQVSGPEAVVSYYHRHGIEAARPGVVDAVHDALVATVLDAGDAA